MIEFLQKLFESDFMSHGHCYFWRPEIVWLHAISDGLIALSYYFIPLMLVYLVRKRRDLPFHWVFFMFGLFILSCGTTHAMEIWTLWHGTYRLAGVIKAITAGASIATGIALVPMVPKALLLPSPAQLQAANSELEKEIAERRRVDEALREERNFIATVLNTVGTPIIVLDLEGRVVQCNRVCEQISGRGKAEMMGAHIWKLFVRHEEGELFERTVEQMRSDRQPVTFESVWSAERGGASLISWSTTGLTDAGGNLRHIIFAGVDITESTRLEREILDISAREQSRIGQDLHDGLGQHMTGIAFMSKVLERKLADRSQPESIDAAKIVHLVNEGINKTRLLARGLLPVGSDSMGLMSALEGKSRELRELFGIPSKFICEEPILIHDATVATHLYRIAQEAVNNAIKHGHPTRVEISLSKLGDGIILSIKDNGVGLPGTLGPNKGMGLQIMSYRARKIGGTLHVGRNVDGGGTLVSCHLPAGIGHEIANAFE